MPDGNDVFYERMKRIFSTVPGNQVHLAEGDRDITIFELPIMGVSDPEDSIFREFKKPEVIGEDWMHPSEWLPETQSVASFFFPFTEEVRGAERKTEGLETAEEWLYARVEGQEFIEAVMQALAEELTGEGILNCVPSLDPRFGTNPVIWDVEGGQDLHVVSRWSERHAAFASGLGTFGLTRAIITERGCAGRFASILTELPLAPTPRKYTSVYGNCIRCGACAERCPVNAISLGHVKNNLACKARVNETGKRYAPRYGCGKCQTRVPCENKNPLTTS